MSKKAIDFIINTLAKQSKPEFYDEYLSHDDIKLRMKRSQDLLDYCRDLLKKNPIENMSNSDLTYLATEMSTRFNRMIHIHAWIMPSNYHRLVEKNGFDHVIINIRETDGDEVIKELISVIQQAKALYEKSNKKLTYEVSIILSNIGKLLGKKNEINEFLTNKAPIVELVFPELMNYSCDSQIAFVPNENKVQISWANIDGAGNISNPIFWWYYFWHESLVRPVLYYSNVLPQIEDIHTFTLCNVIAEYLSIIRLINKMKIDNELINYKGLFNKVLIPKVGINSKWKLKRTKHIKIAQRLCNKMNYHAAEQRFIAKE